MFLFFDKYECINIDITTIKNIDIITIIFLLYISKFMNANKFNKYKTIINNILIAPKTYCLFIYTPSLGRYNNI